MTQFCFAVVKPMPFCDLAEADAERIRDITRIWFDPAEGYPNRLDKYYLNDPIDALNLAVSSNYEWCLLIAEGCLMNAGTDWQALVADHIERAAPDVGAFAHIIDGGPKWFGVHPQTLLIRTAAWTKVAWMQSLFQEGGAVVQLANIERSKENVHDDYTPLWIKPARGTVEIYPRQPGWSLVNGLIWLGWRIENFSNEFRSAKRHLYPEENAGYVDNLTRILQGSLQMRKVYALNTEPIEINAPAPLSILSVPSGFAANEIMMSCGRPEQIVFYDINPDALRYRRFLDEEFSGVHLPGFVSYATEFDFHKPVSDQDWQEVCDRFGGKENFAEHWKAYQQVPKKYLLIDILGWKRKLLLDEIEKDERVVIFFSNIFHNDYSAWHYRRQGREILYRLFFRDVRNKTSNAWMIGRDLDNRPVGQLA